MEESTRDDGARWDARYRDAPDPVPRPPDGLAGLADLVPAGGRALDVACGLGAVTLWAAGLGFRVDALDVSAVAIARLAARAAALGVAEAVLARVADVSAGLPADLDGPYELVVCQRFRDPVLHGSLPRLLAPGGLLVVTALSEVGATSRSRFAAAPGELGTLALASGGEVLRDVEGEGEATVVVRRPGGRSGSADGPVRQDRRDGSGGAREGS
ncbi:class I SAM-dependent methyltransferase [Georgenia sp. SUBG003]|uniref:class I SAM-dependent methyltransferase n=1 Tax=Georgenia sp. SUBG003 TaxID=1497974 RepID=UPI003AB8CC0B